MSFSLHSKYYFFQMLTAVYNKRNYLVETDFYIITTYNVFSFP